MNTYDPELGQAVFGNAYGEFDLGDEEGYVGDRLYNLSRIIGERDPESQAHGLLGGEWGYGQDFQNAVFEMHPYWWGDCECGFEDKEIDWEAEHPHSPNCWQERWGAEHDRLRALDLDYDEEQRRLESWAIANGWEPGEPGVAVFCDCGVYEKALKWLESNNHDPDCPIILPNFRCGDIEVRWYKYIARGMSANRKVSHLEWQETFDRCEQSLS